ncbi:MAG: hypothetical protein ACKO3G_16805 [Planctomycetaceae bacterium]
MIKLTTSDFSYGGSERERWTTACGRRRASLSGYRRMHSPPFPLRAKRRPQWRNRLQYIRLLESIVATYDPSGISSTERLSDELFSAWRAFSETP